MKMKNIIHIIAIATLIVTAAVPVTFAQDSKKNSYSKEMQTKIEETKKELKKFTDEKASVEKNLKTFDELDFVVFTNQEWTRLHESHSHDVKVNWPDGHSTNGIDKHIEDLKAMFVYAPDTNIKVHPVKIGSGDYTSVIGVMSGTFSQPMPIGDGKFIQPTGKKYSITMCTVGHWKDGVMIEEWLFWDNATFMKQIGLGQ
jgi:predicted ester cyclase